MGFGFDQRLPAAFVAALKCWERLGDGNCWTASCAFGARVADPGHPSQASPVTRHARLTSPAFASLTSAPP
jgi:hypothetical protein